MPLMQRILKQCQILPDIVKKSTEDLLNNELNVERIEMKLTGN